MAGQISMQVNGVDIRFERFVDSFVICTVSGMLASLDDTGPLADLDLTLDHDEIHIVLNGKPVDINRFVTRIMKSTLFGMVAPLKGVEIKTVDQLDSLHLKISR